MGQDKALLPHPEGGTWLERTLLLLAALERLLTLFSHHPIHHQVAMGLAQRWGWDNRLERLVEPEPREGPLLALARLMEHHPNPRTDPGHESGVGDVALMKGEVTVAGPDLVDVLP
jgi:molybdopterin-guanine dinucleotide biosynthesis protein A